MLEIINHIAEDVFSRFSPETSTVQEILSYIGETYIENPDFDSEAVREILGKLS
jgi:hypothetical protein